MLSHSWAPCGQTPVLLEKASRDHLSLMAAMAPNGRLIVAGQDQPFRGEEVAWFLGKLCYQYRKYKLLIIWDRATIHRSEAVKTFLRKNPGRVHLEYLPAYSPELNPVELGWSYLKRSLKNQVFTHLEQLQTALLEQIKQLEKQPSTVRKFFYKKEIAFITD